MRLRWSPAIALTVLAVALASCGLLNSFVPPIDDPLGLDGTEVPLRNEAVLVPSAPSTQQAVSTFSGSFDTTLPDLSDPPAEPKSLRTELGFDPIVLSGSPLMVAEADFPESLVVDSIVVGVTLRDGDASVELAFAASGLAVEFEREAGCSVGTVVTCRYAPVSATIEGLSMRIAGDDFGALFDVLTGGAQDNEVEGRLSIGIAPSVDPAVELAVVTIRTTPGRIDVF